MEYRLKIDGDDFEKEGWNLFAQDKFPHYEIFWQTFVVPKTNRPKNIGLKKGTLIEERKIAMLHYAIFKHFFTIYRNIPQFNKLDLTSKREVFESLYGRLSSIIDLTLEFLLRFDVIYKNKRSTKKLIYESLKDLNVERDEINNGKSLKISVVLKKSKKDFEKALKKDFEKGKDSGVTLISKREILEKKYDNTNKEPIFKTFNTLSGEIKEYRNKIVHSWPMFQIDSKIPKQEFVNNWEYLDWTKIADKLETNKREEIINKHFIDMLELLMNSTDNLIKLMDDIWETIVIPSLSKEKDSLLPSKKEYIFPPPNRSQTSEQDLYSHMAIESADATTGSANIGLGSRLKK